MGRKEITTKEDLMKVIELFENTGITYWLYFSLVGNVIDYFNFIYN